MSEKDKFFPIVPPAPSLPQVSRPQHTDVDKVRNENRSLDLPENAAKSYEGSYRGGNDGIITPPDLKALLNALIKIISKPAASVIIWLILYFLAAFKISPILGIVILFAAPGFLFIAFGGKDSIPPPPPDPPLSFGHGGDHGSNILNIFRHEIFRVLRFGGYTTLAAMLVALIIEQYSQSWSLIIIFLVFCCFSYVTLSAGRDFILLMRARKHFGAD